MLNRPISGEDVCARRYFLDDNEKIERYEIVRTAQFQETRRYAADDIPRQGRVLAVLGLGLQPSQRMVARWRLGGKYPELSNDDDFGVIETAGSISAPDSVGNVNITIIGYVIRRKDSKVPAAVA